MKFPSIFKNKDTKPALLRQWSSCKHPKTQSFRKEDEIFRTVNSVYFGPLDIGIADSRESWFTDTSASASFSTETEEDSVETIVRGARSERLFFEPGCGKTSSILEETTPKSSSEMFALKESVALAMESEDPYMDFKRSMQEMVEINGLKDWESLEELLGWYLKMNEKMNHGFILGAFVDLLRGLAASSFPSPSSVKTSFLSASSSLSSPSCSSPPSSIDEKRD